MGYRGIVEEAKTSPPILQVCYDVRWQVFRVSLKAVYTENPGWYTALGTEINLDRLRGYLPCIDVKRDTAELRQLESKLGAVEVIRRAFRIVNLLNAVALSLPRELLQSGTISEAFVPTAKAYSKMYSDLRGVADVGLIGAVESWDWEEVGRDLGLLFYGSLHMDPEQYLGVPLTRLQPLKKKEVPIDWFARVKKDLWMRVQTAKRRSGKASLSDIPTRSYLRNFLELMESVSKGRSLLEIQEAAEEAVVTPFKGARN